MKAFYRSMKQSLLAMVIIAALILGSAPQAVLAAGETTLNVADWSATTTLANVSGRPTVLFDNGTYHMWHSNNSDMTLYYTTSTDPTNFALGTQATFPDATEVSSPAILLEDGTFYMVKYADETAKVFAMYTSTDGINWADAGVVYDGTGLEAFDAGWLKFDAPYLLKDGDTYKLYFQMKGSATGTPYYIFMAETGATTLAAIADANDDIDFTLANANQPVLSPGDVLGAENRVMHPMVVKEGSSYYMWYTGHGSYPTEGRVFFASSADGIHWVKGRGLEVIDAAESPMSAEPTVVNTGAGWHMWYLSNSARIKHVSASGPFQFSTIQAAVNAATAGDTINVAPGTYLEEVNLNKAGLHLMGAGYETTTIMGRKDAGGSNTLTLAANDLLVDGFTITRDGNNVTDWAANVKTQGVIFNQGTTGSTLQNCRVTGNRNGVYLNNTQNQTVRNNLITNNRTGIQLVNNVTGLVVSENEITNNWTMGVLFNFNSGSYTTSVQITNNNISGNWYGEIQNRWAVDNGVMNVSGNWFGSTAITTSTENSSEPGYATQIPVEFGGTATPPSTPVAIIGGVQSAMVDYSPWLASGIDTEVDEIGFQGDFSALNVDDDSAQSGAVGRIQEGVNLAAVGGTVNVLAGTYPEQVTISKDILLQGADGASIIQAYASMPVCFTTSYAHRPIVCVKDTANATIQGFTIDGLGLGNTNNRFVGVAFRNAGGTIQSSTIQDVRDTPFSGAQHGVGIYVYNDDAVARTIHLLDNTLTGFQKTGIALNGSATNPLTVDVQRNTVTGAGATTVTAQNGIQVWAEAGSGVVADNTISGIAYDNTASATKYVATSILNYYTDLSTTGNTITGAHMGIYYYEGRGLIENNTLTIEKIGVYAYGINAADPPQAVPSPYSEAPAELAAALAMDPVTALDEVEITGNTLTFSGTDKTATYGIEADAGYGANDLSVDIHHNSVNGFDNGLVLYQCESDCGTGVFTAISAVSNDLTDNTTGIYLGGAIPATLSPVIHHNRVYSTGETDSGLFSDLATSITAENNWWGCNAGPADAACTSVTGLVDAEPWLVLTLSADQNQLVAGSTINLVASLIENSQGDDTSTSGYVMDGIPVDFATTFGTLTPESATLVNGAAIFTLDVPDPMTESGATVSATLDGQTVEINFNGIRYLFLPFISR